jgi:hypothetical protein
MALEALELSSTCEWFARDQIPHNRKRLCSLASPSSTQTFSHTWAALPIHNNDDSPANSSLHIHIRAERAHQNAPATYEA